jgi:preprotein translocase subunit SecE
MMTDQDQNVDDKSTEQQEEEELEQAEIREQADLVRTDEADEAEAMPTQLGATRHVLAGFFAAGIGVAYVVSKVLVGSWNRIADNHWVAQHAAFVSRIAEDDRSTFTALIGGAVGIFTTVYAYRRPDIRNWTNEVATELAKVSWPSKKEVTNSTMVVIAASTFATVFLALLDRFWGFVTNLVYGS